LRQVVKTSLLPPSVTRDKAEWPPDYTAAQTWREATLARMADDPELLTSAKQFYSTRPVEFICAWLDTYDPRKAATGEPPWMPFILFERQAEFVDFIMECLGHEVSGLCEKSRDMGITWTAIGVSIWLWLFYDGASIGWGSHKQNQVDRLGDLDSIFEKIRQAIRRCPSVFWPAGFNPDDHLLAMRIINPENGNTITGEIGPNIGRGGRKLIYFKDESAHYEHPETIEASLMDNTRVQIDISSVNGLGNVFHRKRDNGKDWGPGEEVVRDRTNVFVMDWRDHPEKTQEWYDERHQRAESDGLLHVFAQEVDRNYSAAVVGTIIPADWLKSCIDAHVVLEWDRTKGNVISALDVADGGGDTNAQATRRGSILEALDEWGERDTALTARRAVKNVEGLSPRTSLQYDAIGVGAGVKAETNRLRDEHKLPKGLKVEPWNAAASPLRPDDHVIPGDRQSPVNKDFYGNLKAQGWWELRNRVERTHRAIKNGEVFKVDELISLTSSLPQLQKLLKELSQPCAGTTANMKLIVNKTPEGTKSPNLADAVMMCYWPAYQSTYNSNFSEWV